MRVITNSVNPTLVRETKSDIEDLGLRAVIKEEFGHDLPISPLRSYNNAIVDGVNDVYLVFINGQFYAIDHFRIYDDTYIVGIGWKLTSEEGEKFENNSLDIPSELKDTELQFILINE